LFVLDIPWPGNHGIPGSTWACLHPLVKFGFQEFATAVFCAYIVLFCCQGFRVWSFRGNDTESQKTERVKNSL
jgi:hypothetical protein